MERVRLFVHGSLEQASDEELDGLCRSVEARALGPPFTCAVALPIAGAVVREAQAAEGLWPSLPWCGGVSVGTAPTRHHARLFRCQFQPTWLQPFRQPLVDPERLGSVLKAADQVIQIADSSGFALQALSSLLFQPYLHHIMPGDMAEEPTDTAPLGGTRRDRLHTAIRHHDAGVEPPAHARQHAGIPHPQWYEPHRPRLVQTAEDVPEVSR